jgi:hypothetical protein
MGLRVRIPPVLWIGVSVSCECCAVCCQVGVSASGWSLGQRRLNECGVSSECVREASIMRRPWPTRGCCAMGGGKLGYCVLLINHNVGNCLQ